MPSTVLNLYTYINSFSPHQGSYYFLILQMREHIYHEAALDCNPGPVMNNHSVVQLTTLMNNHCPYCLPGNNSGGPFSDHD